MKRGAGVRQLSQMKERCQISSLKNIWKVQSGKEMVGGGAAESFVEIEFGTGARGE